MKNSKMYKLMELNDGIDTAIENANKVLGEQKVLINALETTSVEHDFSELIDKLKEQNEDITKKINNMELRKKFLNEILFIYNSGLTKDAKKELVAGSNFVDEICTKLMVALGLEDYEEETEDKKE